MAHAHVPQFHIPHFHRHHHATDIPKRKDAPIDDVEWTIPVVAPGPKRNSFSPWTPDCSLKEFDEVRPLEYLNSLVDISLSRKLSIGRIVVDVIEAANLPAADFCGTSDPYCTVEVSGFYGKSAKKLREWDPGLRTSAATLSIKQTLNPVWLTSGMRFQLKRHGAVLKVKVFDFDELATDDPLGHVVISVNSLLPGVHEGWCPLHDPNDNQDRTGTMTFNENLFGATTALHAGPAVRLRITFEHSPLGELCSYVWEPPKTVNPTIHRFDPNELYHAVMTIQSKLVANVASVAGGLIDAVFWKRGPAHTLAALAVSLFVCNHIDRFWILLHGALAGSIVATGIITRFGKKPLVFFWRNPMPPPQERQDGDSVVIDSTSPEEMSSMSFSSLSSSNENASGKEEEKEEEDHERKSGGRQSPSRNRLSPAEESAAPSAMAAAPTVGGGEGEERKNEEEAELETTRRRTPKKSSSMASLVVGNNEKAAEEKLKTPQQTAADPKRPFTGLKELTLRKAGRMVGGGRPMAEAQMALLDGMQMVDMLEGLVTWKRQNYRLGFKELDGPVLATGFVMGNLVAVSLHLLVELRFIAMTAVLGIFTFTIVERLGTMLPQGLKVRKLRAKLHSAKQLGERPPQANPTRKNKKGLERVIVSIFKRVDADKSGTVTLEELLDALPEMDEKQKDSIRDVFFAADGDGSGELNAKEFRDFVCFHTTSIAMPLVVAELSRCLRSAEGFHDLRKLPSTAKSLRWLQFMPWSLHGIADRSEAGAPNHSSVTMAATTAKTVLNQRSHDSALRVNDQDSGGPSLLYQRRAGKWSAPIRVSKILRIEADAGQLVAVVFEDEDKANAVARLVFDVGLEAVRDALLSSLERALGLAKTDGDGGEEDGEETKGEHLEPLKGNNSSDRMMHPSPGTRETGFNLPPDGVFSLETPVPSARSSGGPQRRRSKLVDR